MCNAVMVYYGILKLIHGNCSDRHFGLKFLFDFYFFPTSAIVAQPFHHFALHNVHQHKYIYNAAYTRTSCTCTMYIYCRQVLFINIVGATLRIHFVVCFCTCFSIYFIYQRSIYVFHFHAVCLFVCFRFGMRKIKTKQKKKHINKFIALR